MSFYTATVLLSWIGLGVLCILVSNNGRLSAEDKRIFYITYVLIAVAALAEWLAEMMNGAEGVPIWALRIAKCADFIFTPLSTIALVEQMKMRNIWRKLLIVVLVANTVIQIAFSFTDSMIGIIPDAHNAYVPGPLYPLYLALSMAALLFAVIEFIIYGRAYKRQNAISIYAIVGLIVAGVCMQEVSDGEVKTLYLSLTIASALFYIHLAEFSQERADEHIQEQRVLISTDALTGLLSRYAYSATISEMDAMPALPNDLAVFSMDINGLKKANDTYGHEAGDELICAAASCIQKVLGEKGQCYRTGGDEFVAVAKMTKEQAGRILSDLEREADTWIGKQNNKLSISAGYALAADHPELSFEKLINEADMVMYEKKAAFYKDRTGR